MYEKSGNYQNSKGLGPQPSKVYYDQTEPCGAQTQAMLDELHDQLCKSHAYLCELRNRVARIADRVFGPNPQTETGQCVPAVPEGSVHRLGIIHGDISRTLGALSGEINRIESL